MILMEIQIQDPCKISICAWSLQESICTAGRLPEGCKELPFPSARSHHALSPTWHLLCDISPAPNAPIVVRAPYMTTNNRLHRLRDGKNILQT